MTAMDNGTGAARDEILLDVRHLKQYFGKADVRAVDDVSFYVKKGEVFGLVGESGYGKTSTGRAIVRLDDITSGDIYFKGRRIAAGTRSYTDAIAEEKKASALRVEALQREGRPDEVRRERERLAEFVRGQKAAMAAAKADQRRADREKLSTRIQMIFQDSAASLNPRMTVREIVAEGLRLQGVRDKALMEEKVCRMLERVGLAREHAGRCPHELSGGQRQRVGIARAVIMDPELVIADEPVSAQDVSIQAQVIDLLHDLRRSMGLTVLFIAHDLGVVKCVSDRIAVMYSGRIVELADAGKLFARPLHPYTRSLLSAIPRPDPHYERRRKRMVYDPAREHDDSREGPGLREIAPGHFVSCNAAEFERLGGRIS